MYEKENIEVIDTRDILHPDSKLRSRLGLPPAPSPHDELFSFLFDLTEMYPCSHIALDEVPMELLIQKQTVHHEDFKGTLRMAVSPVALHDFRDQDDKTELSNIPVESSQGFIIIHLKRNMRNSCRILQSSFKVQEGIIERGTLNTSLLHGNQSQEMPLAEHNLSSKLEYSDKQEEESLQSTESLRDIDTLVARLVEDGKDAIYRAPAQEATGCPTIPGENPQVFKGEKASEFVTETIPNWCSEKRGAFVIIGNEKEDLNWIMTCLEKKLL